MAAARVRLAEALRILRDDAARLDANGRRADEMAALVAGPRAALADLQAYKAAESERLACDPTADRDPAELGLKVIRLSEARSNAQFARQTLGRLAIEHGALAADHCKLALPVHEAIVAVLAEVAGDLAERQRAAEVDAAKCAAAITAIRRSLTATPAVADLYGPFGGRVLEAAGQDLSTEAHIARQEAQRQAAADVVAFAEPFGELLHRLQSDPEATVEEVADER